MSESIMHYGVKGMRWGVRKERQTSSGERGKKATTKRTYDSIREKMRAKRPKPASEMSDKELRDAINRLQMEKTYSQLSAGTVKQGQAFVGKVLKGSASTVATAFAVKGMTKAVEQLMKRAAGGGH